MIDNGNLANRGDIIQKLYGLDKIHLSTDGTRILATNMSHEMKNVMGLTRIYENKEPRNQVISTNSTWSKNEWQQNHRYRGARGRWYPSGPRRAYQEDWVR